MSILTTKFIKLFTVILKAESAWIKAFLVLLQHRQIVKAKKHAFSTWTTAKKFSIVCVKQQRFISLELLQFCF